MAGPAGRRPWTPALLMTRRTCRSTTSRGAQHPVCQKYPPPLPEDDQPMPCWTASPGARHQTGLERFEVSATPAGRQRCRHNLNYGKFGDYLGILGAGATASSVSLTVWYGGCVGAIRCGTWIRPWLVRATRNDR